MRPTTFGFSMPSFNKKEKEEDLMAPFWIVDVWRQKLLNFIEQKSGHASRDTQWNLMFFEF